MLFIQRFAIGLALGGNELVLATLQLVNQTLVGWRLAGAGFLEVSDGAGLHCVEDFLSDEIDVLARHGHVFDEFAATLLIVSKRSLLNRLSVCAEAIRKLAVRQHGVLIDDTNLLLRCNTRQRDLD